MADALVTGRRVVHRIGAVFGKRPQTAPDGRRPMPWQVIAGYTLAGLTSLRLPALLLWILALLGVIGLLRFFNAPFRRRLLPLGVQLGMVAVLALLPVASGVFTPPAGRSAAFLSSWWLGTAALVAAPIAVIILLGTRAARSYTRGTEVLNADIADAEPATTPGERRPRQAPRAIRSVRIVLAAAAVLYVAGRAARHGIRVAGSIDEPIIQVQQPVYLLLLTAMVGGAAFLMSRLLQSPRTSTRRSARIVLLTFAIWSGVSALGPLARLPDELAYDPSTATSLVVIYAVGDVLPVAAMLSLAALLPLLLRRSSRNWCDPRPTPAAASL